jgi:pimeloyl-ACP methyl ester carboxylesterase
VKIVFLHAFPLDERMWEAQGSAFSENVDIPNLYRLGRSMDEWAESVLAETEGSFVACGASMGGYSALAIARVAPERLEGLVLAGARVDADSDERRAARAKTIELIRSEGAAGLWEDMRPKLFADTASEEVVERARRIALEQDPDTLVTAVEAIRDRLDSTDAFAALDVPVLVAAGEHDPFLSVDEARTAAEAARDGRLQVFEGCGHLPSIERPDEFNRVLAAFREKAG